MQIVYTYSNLLMTSSCKFVTCINTHTDISWRKIHCKEKKKKKLKQENTRNRTQLHTCAYTHTPWIYIYIYIYTPRPTLDLLSKEKLKNKIKTYLGCEKAIPQSQFINTWRVQYLEDKALVSI